MTFLSSLPAGVPMGDVGPDAEIRGIAKRLEYDGDPHNGKNHPVKIKMPSGVVIECGGECLVSALSHGGKPVEK